MNIIQQLRQTIQGPQLTWCIARAVKLSTKSFKKEIDLFHSIRYNFGKSFSSSGTFYSTSSSACQHVAIVGSGPAGYYTAQKLLKVLMEKSDISLSYQASFQVIFFMNFPKFCSTHFHFSKEMSLFK